ncbi:MAG: acetoin utilization deacetylase AcuC-like enzyme [Planctomycetota bacterium]
MVKISKQTGFVTSPAFLEHDTGPAHPERAARLQAVHERLESAGLFDELETLQAAPADLSWIDRVHDAQHASGIQSAIQEGETSFDTDTLVSSGSWDAALRAVGGTLQACDKIMCGEWANAFVASRPPGHHAESNKAMGYCLFNNVVIAARYLQEKHGIERVAILDWDVHHGNGTQHLTEHDPTLHFTSLHQFPHYPGTGAAGEIGTGEGRGSVLNCPMDAGDGDQEYLRIFESRVLRAIESFDPGFILISAGFDAHLRDPLSGTVVSADGFQAMSESIASLAGERCKGRILSLLEGGYDLQGLAESVEVHLSTLLENR